uniref:Uncharacterized protein n=1 Tax=Ditylenchus dipsaci TaxID=166011 RepID=A0A915EAI4_9BILA
MEIAAKNPLDANKYGSTVHIIAAAKLLDVNILTYNEAIGWTLYTPDIKTGPSAELLQDDEKPTYSLYYNVELFSMDTEKSVESKQETFLGSVIAYSLADIPRRTRAIGRDRNSMNSFSSTPNSDVSRALARLVLLPLLKCLLGKKVKREPEST